MTQGSDRAIIDVVERSLLVKGAERARLTIAGWLSGARSLTWLEGVRREAGPHWGASLLTAAVVHVAITGFVAPPSHFYWLVLPGMAGAAGLAHLMSQRRSPGGRIG